MKNKKFFFSVVLSSLLSSGLELQAMHEDKDALQSASSSLVAISETESPSKTVIYSACMPIKMSGLTDIQKKHWPYMAHVMMHRLPIVLENELR